MKLRNQLSSQYSATNRNHQEGNNPYLEVRKNGELIISSPKQDETEKEDGLALQSFFPEQLVRLPEIFATVTVTQFLPQPI